MTFPLSLENPILTREMRTRMRGAKAFWILMVYLGLLSLILGGTYLSWWNSQNRGMGTATASYDMGRLFYGVLFAVQAALVGLITPALTAGALTIEREQRTFEALTISPLSRRAIVVGKLTSAVAFVGLLLVGSLPLVAVCFLLGGVSPEEVAVAYLLLLVSAFLYGATGIAYSAFAKNTAMATLLTYTTILVFFLGTLPLALSGIDFTTASVSPYTASFLLAVNPVGAMIAGGLTESYFGIVLPSWLTALSVNGLLGTILTTAALHRVEYPRSDRSPLLRCLTMAFVALIAFYGFGQHSEATYLVPLFTLLFVPLFVAGDSLPSGPLRPQLWRLKSGNPVSGLTFTALLLVPVTVFSALSGGNALLSSLITLSAVFGFGTLTLLLSQKLKNRWVVITLSVGVLTLVYFLPFAAEVVYGTEKHTVFVNTLYLSPIATSAADRLGTDGEALAWGREMMPWINISFTSLLGLASLGLLKRARR